MTYGAKYPQAYDLELLSDAERVMAQRLWEEAGLAGLCPGALPADGDVQTLKSAGTIESADEQPPRRRGSLMWGA